MYYVYIIKSKKDDSLYTGFTKDIRRRMLQHNSGESLHTKNKIPWKIVWIGIFLKKNTAAAFEQYLKTASGIAFRNKRLV